MSDVAKVEAQELNVDDVVSQAGYAPVETAEDKPKEESTETAPEAKPEEETETPESESVTDENKPENQQKGVQKRIDTLTRQKKEAQEENERLKALLAEKEEKKDEFALTPEQMQEAVLQKATERVMNEDKDKPLEERRILSADEIDELGLESAGKLIKWQDKYGNFERDLQKQIEASAKPQEEAPVDDAQKQNLDYEGFVAEYPELDFMDLMKDIPRELFAEDKSSELISKLKEKDETVGAFFEFVHKNFAKYPSSDTWSQAAKDYSSQKGELEKESLAKKIKELEAENERLSNIDTGIRSTKPGSPEERQENEVASSVDAVLAMTPFGKK
jgi:hypothetical protein